MPAPYTLRVLEEKNQRSKAQFRLYSGVPAAINGEREEGTTPGASGAGNCHTGVVAGIIEIWF